MKYSWKLNTRKCNLYMTEAKWCGRIISGKGIRHDPAGLYGLTQMECPTTRGQLQQYLCAKQWLRSSIPQCQPLVRNPHEFLEKVYAHVGKRIKRAVSRVCLKALGWTAEQLLLFGPVGRQYFTAQHFLIAKSPSDYESSQIPALPTGLWLLHKSQVTKCLYLTRIKLMNHFPFVLAALRKRRLAGLR